MKPDCRREVEEFRAWAATQDPEDIEWEIDYGEEKWDEIHQSVSQFLATSTPTEWIAEEVEDLLYLLARDSVWAEVASCLQRNLDAAVYLASESLSWPDVESASRWELAKILGHFSDEPQVEALLLRFAGDEAEFTRRMALQSLARLGASHTETLALREWHRDDQNQQWARMMALACWHHVGSLLLEAHLAEAEGCFGSATTLPTGKLEAHLAEAEDSPLPYLADFARRLRRGEVAPLA